MNEHKKINRTKTLKKVFRYLGKYKIYFLFSVLLAGVSVALTLYVPKLIGYERRGTDALQYGESRV